MSNTFKGKSTSTKVSASVFSILLAAGFMWLMTEAGVEMEGTTGARLMVLIVASIAAAFLTVVSLVMAALPWEK